MSFYRLRQFQCEVTGKSGLDYFQAIESELSEARTMHARFPEQLKSAVLKAVQWREYPNRIRTMYASLFIAF
jgi:bromodomain adjacent to zinc finger domain protein 1A